MKYKVTSSIEIMTNIQQNTQEKWLIHVHDNWSNSIDYYHLFDSHDSAYEYLKNYVQTSKEFICMDSLREIYEDEIPDSDIEGDEEDGDEEDDSNESYDEFVKEFIKNPPDTIISFIDGYIVMTKFYKNHASRP